MKKRSWLTFTLLIIFSSGCSLNQYALRKVADAISADNSNYAKDNDLETIRLASPFGLKLMEQLFATLKDHKQLPVALAAGWTQYVFIFIQQELNHAQQEITNLESILSQESKNAIVKERTEEKKISQEWKRDTLKERAKRLLIRARDFALTALEQRHKGIRELLLAGTISSAQKAALLLKKDDVPIIYWTIASWLLFISDDHCIDGFLFLDTSVDSLLKRALELDPNYNHGVIHDLSMSRLAETSSGDQASIDSHYQAALTLSQGKRLLLKVSYAEGMLKEKNHPQYVKMLTEVINTDIESEDEGWRNNRLANTVAKQRAQWLLKQVR